MRWDEFSAACPEIATLGEERFRRDEFCLLGTVRRDGSPRISPCELDFVDGELMLGMMWRSHKALDLLRDSRCVLHSGVSNRHGADGDVKVYGTAVAVDDAARRERYCETIRARIGWAPDEPGYHLFAIDVTAAGYVIFGDDRHAAAWDLARGYRRLPLLEDEA